MTGMFLNLEIAEERQAQVRRDVRASNGRFRDTCGEHAVGPDEYQRTPRRAGVLNAAFGLLGCVAASAAHVVAAMMRGRST